MTEKRDLKKRIRDRQTGDGRVLHDRGVRVMRARAELLGLPNENDTTAVVTRAEAIVLKVNDQSARVRVLGEEGQLTFRSADAWSVVPGHVVTLVIDRRWTWHGDEYASGHIERPRIDVARLALEPLPLELYSLRHGFATTARRAGVPSDVRDRLLGHRPRDTKAMYHEDEDLPLLARERERIVLPRWVRA